MDELFSKKTGKAKNLHIYDNIKQDYVQDPQCRGKKLPSEVVLCKKYEVSRSTVRKALNLLTEEELIYKIKGSGTFIKTTDDTHEVSRQIVLILQGVDTVSNGRVINGIKNIFDSINTNLQIYLTYNKLSEERACLKKILRRNIVGVIVEGVHANVLNTNLDMYYALENKGIPVIFYNNYYRNTDFPKIIMNDILTADFLVKKLVENGHRYIAGIFMYDNYQGVEKYTGFIKALIKHGATCDDRYVKWFGTGENETKLFKDSLWAFIKKLKNCTAIVCCNHVIKGLVLELLAQHSKQVPDDYSLAAFDCPLDDCERTRVFSSIHPSYEIGQEVARKILLMLQKTPEYKEEDFSVTFSPRIYEGESVKNLLTDCYIK